MAKEGRAVLAVNTETGECREYGSAYKLSQDIDVTPRSIMQALERNGVCKGWRIYDTPERIRERIAELEKQLSVVENL